MTRAWRRSSFVCSERRSGRAPRPLAGRPRVARIPNLAPAVEQSWPAEEASRWPRQGEQVPEAQPQANRGRQRQGRGRARASHGDETFERALLGRARGGRAMRWEPRRTVCSGHVRYEGAARTDGESCLGLEYAGGAPPTRARAAERQTRQALALPNRFGIPRVRPGRAPERHKTIRLQPRVGTMIWPRPSVEWRRALNTADASRLNLDEAIEHAWPKKATRRPP